MNRPPDHLDHEHQTLWEELKAAKTANTKVLLFVVPIILSALGTLLALSLSISDKLTQHLEDGGKLGARLNAHIHEVERDLNDKYSRHLPVHDALERRLERHEDKGHYNNNQNGEENE